MSEREPRAGDVCRTTIPQYPVVVLGSKEEDASSQWNREWNAQGLDGGWDHFLPSELTVLFNLPDLLASDPAAWAEALRFAPEGLLAINEQYPGFPACICAALESEKAPAPGVGKGEA